MPLHKGEGDTAGCCRTDLAEHGEQLEYTYYAIRV